MDAIIELVLELFFGALLASDQVKARTKTILMSLIVLAGEGLFLFGFYCVFREGDRPLLTILMLALSVWFGWIGVKEIISGHKRGWKNHR